MRSFYLSLFRATWSWSAKQEFDGRASLFSASIYVSALQLLNLISGFFIIEASNWSRIDVPRWVAVVVPVALLTANGIWASRNEQQIRDSEGRPVLAGKRRNPFVTAYVVATVVAFFVSTLIFVYTAPIAN